MIGSFKLATVRIHTPVPPDTRPCGQFGVLNGYSGPVPRPGFPGFLHSVPVLPDEVARHNSDLQS
jgi:hypothetical protein